MRRIQEEKRARILITPIAERRLRLWCTKVAIAARREDKKKIFLRLPHGESNKRGTALTLPGREIAPPYPSPVGEGTLKGQKKASLLGRFGGASSLLGRFGGAKVLVSIGRFFPNFILRFGKNGRKEYLCTKIVTEEVSHGTG